MVFAVVVSDAVVAFAWFRARVEAHGGNRGHATAILKIDGFLQVPAIYDFVPQYFRTFLSIFSHAYLLV